MIPQCKTFILCPHGFVCSDIESRDLRNVALVYSEVLPQECPVFGGATLLSSHIVLSPALWALVLNTKIY